MTDYAFFADEQPASPGSPYTPRLARTQRLVYGTVGVLIGLMSTFPNALTNVNLANISGSLGLYVAQASCLPALYFGMNASSNLALVKGRAQFGIPLISQGLLALYALTAAVQLMWPGLLMAALARLTNGLAAGALNSLCIFYLLVALPVRARPLALVVGISLTQFGTPLARLIPVELLALNQWWGLHCLELAVPLALLVVTLIFPLPPSERVVTFERTDVLSIALLMPGIVLACIVLGMGKAYWWHDTPLLGELSMACALLIAAGVLIEANRERPLLRLQWLSAVNIARFIGVAFLMRLALAEQTFGSVGLLAAAGLNNDQMHDLFELVALSMVTGIIVTVTTLQERRLPLMVVLAATCIGVAALLDSQSSNLTRPHQLYLSQSLIGFGTTLFIGPVLLYGFIQMLRQGRENMISLVVVFSITQNVGALAGSAILGSYQLERSHVQGAALSDHLTIGASDVSARLATGSAALRAVVPDPLQAAVQSEALLARSLNEEATILAFNNAFQLLAGVAGLVVLMVSLSILRRHLFQTSKQKEP
ncbi:MFS transporter [Herbaspirillum sp.]|uniref:MFS transporter n=1 Tax=Herbaspirillum sp. TaxID=1890675 RepID=UPI0031D4AF99